MEDEMAAVIDALERQSKLNGGAAMLAAWAVVIGIPDWLLLLNPAMKSVGH
jgi:hypothetical protein